MFGRNFLRENIHGDSMLEDNENATGDCFKPPGVFCPKVNNVAV